MSPICGPENSAVVEAGGLQGEQLAEDVAEGFAVEHALRAATTAGQAKAGAGGIRGTLYAAATAGRVAHHGELLIEPCAGGVVDVAAQGIAELGGRGGRGSPGIVCRVESEGDHGEQPRMGEEVVVGGHAIGQVSRQQGETVDQAGRAGVVAAGGVRR